jgi:hypothetical protein
MTWVIGRAGPFGYAVGLSDIRITLIDGTELDCLQKVYKIGNQMVLGFAGSVAIGMENVAQLSEALHVPGKGGVWDPCFVAEMLPIGAKKLFNSFDSTEQELGCELILLGAHPTEKDGAAPWAKCYVYRFYGPDFEPINSDGTEIVSIGSGSDVDQYIEALDKLSNDYEMFKLEAGIFAGSGLGLMTSVSSVLKKFLVPGISRHLHVCIVGRDGLKLGTNNFEAPDKPDLHFVVPPVATSLEELRQIIDGSIGSTIPGASC